MIGRGTMRGVNYGNSGLNRDVQKRDVRNKVTAAVQKISWPCLSLASGTGATARKGAFTFHIRESIDP